MEDKIQLKIAHTLKPPPSPLGSARLAEAWVPPCWIYSPSPSPQRSAVSVLVVTPALCCRVTSPVDAAVLTPPGGPGKRVSRCIVLLGGAAGWVPVLDGKAGRGPVLGKATGRGPEAQRAPVLFGAAGRGPMLCGAVGRAPVLPRDLNLYGARVTGEETRLPHPGVTGLVNGILGAPFPGGTTLPADTAAAAGGPAAPAPFTLNPGAPGSG